MKERNWQVNFGVILLVASITLFFIHFYVFDDLHHILIFGVHDIAFLPMEVLLVTLIIHQMLERREKNSRLQKLNMVIGSFYSEVGTKLLAYLSDNDPELDHIKAHLCIDGSCSDREFSEFTKTLKHINYRIDVGRIDLNHVKHLVSSNKDFMLRLLENPNLLEHESFTELLFAVFHMTEEFKARSDFENLPLSDLTHLEIDVNRVYGLLVHRWLDYMKHVKDNHPYLFSLYVRTNPFDEKSSPIVTEV